MTSVLASPATGPALAGPVVGVDALDPTARAADHTAATLVAVLEEAGVAEDALVLTHVTWLGPRPHVALSVSAALPPDALRDLVVAALPEAVVSAPLAPDPPGTPVPEPAEPGLDDGSPASATGGSTADAAHAAATAHARRTGGRAVHYPGREHLVGTLAVGDVPALSAVEQVVVLGQDGPVDDALALVTRDHVRPTYDRGRLVLVTERAVGDVLIPFESPDPRPCCADHA